MDDHIWRTCNIFHWYSIPSLSEVTFPTKFVRIPDRLVNRIVNSPGIFCQTLPTTDPFSDEEDESVKIEKPLSTIPHTEDEEEIQSKKEKATEIFPIFESEIQSIISQWSKSHETGGVFPKTNWSAPLDAHWIAVGGSLRCSTVQEVLLLLQASDSIRADLELIQSISTPENPIYPTLALRKWHDFKSPALFRCFIRNHSLVAISQKDVTECFPTLVESKELYMEKIKSFVSTKILTSIQLNDFVCDVYIHSNNKIYIVDISPFIEEYTNTLLWTWEEILILDGPTQIRIIEHPTGVVPHLQKLATAVPFDFIDTEDSELANLNPRDMEELFSKLKKSNK